MERPRDYKAQDILDQITDTITNRYEDGYKYTARELREILDAIVAVLVLDYCRERKRVSGEPVGFEVSVDKEQAMTWLAVHRRTLWQELKSLHG